MDAYAHLQELCTPIVVENYQETRATAADRAGGNAEAARAVVTQAKACIARTKFNTQGTPMFEMLQLFKAVQILCPQQARAIGLTAAHVRALTIVPGLGDDATIDSLLDELPAYIVAAAADAPIDEDCPLALCGGVIKSGSPPGSLLHALSLPYTHRQHQQSVCSL